MIMLKTRITLTAAAACAALAVTGGVASAAPHPAPVHAVTVIMDRPDGGNGSPDPYWAGDSMTRSVTITRTGGAPGAYTYRAVLADVGWFTAIRGKQTPNQSGPYAGQTIRSAVTGSMAGWADFTFTASALPSAGFNAGVPAWENDHGVPSAGQPTSTWYEQAFPAGTTFGGAGIGAWSWSYTAYVPPAGPGWRFVPLVRQHWLDAWDNGYGDLPGDGNIAG
jgi:hypothetical protein